MSQILINVENNQLETFLKFLRTLTYIKVKKVEKEPIEMLDKVSELAFLQSIQDQWQDDRSAETIIDDLRSMRVFTRQIESL